jgi:very-short-patch-repair endonuclease
VTAARPIPHDAEGAGRARSASEAFLYRRLETLAETRGRFQLNTDLAIAFDGFGRMEIDLLCADSRLVVEIDGAQHLADPIAYRRDRRKDQLLQENVYRVLRFFAEDLAKGLGTVLDAILRSLGARQRPAASTHALRFCEESFLRLERRTGNSGRRGESVPSCRADRLVAVSIICGDLTASRQSGIIPP